MSDDDHDEFYSREFRYGYEEALKWVLGSKAELRESIDEEIQEHLKEIKNYPLQ